MCFPKVGSLVTLFRYLELNCIFVCFSFFKAVVSLLLRDIIIKGLAKKPHVTGLVETRFETVQECLKLHVGLSQLAIPSGCLALWKPLQEVTFCHGLWGKPTLKAWPPGHGSTLVPVTALQASCLETLRSAFRKTNFVWCVCGGEKYGLGRQKPASIKCCQLAYTRRVTAAGVFIPVLWGLYDWEPWGRNQLWSVSRSISFASPSLDKGLRASYPIHVAVKSMYLLWFTAINLACINSGWQSPDGVYACSYVPHFKQEIVASEFPPGKRAKAGRASPRASIFLWQAGAWACACLLAPVAHKCPCAMPFAERGISRVCLPSTVQKDMCAMCKGRGSYCNSCWRGC